MTNMMSPRDAETEQSRRAQGPRQSRPRPAWRSPYLAIWVATAVLFVISPVIAPGSLGVGALQSVLPFAAILVVAAVGQTLVIQQRGLDLSVPGVVSLSAIVVTKVAEGQDSRLVLALVAAIGVGVLSGLGSGLVVTVLRVTPLVATLGVNALLIGTVLRVTSGSQTVSASPALSSFSTARVLGVPALVIVAVVLVLLVTFVLRSTTTGRRFVAIGTSVTAAHAAGMPVRRYQCLTYTVAATCGALAGVLAAGYLQTPGLGVGDNYLLPSIAAVVLGGTALAGGGGSVVATAGGALFLTQLQQVVFGAGVPASGQLLIQSIAIGLGMAVRRVPWRRVAALRGPSSSVPGSPGPATPKGPASRSA